MRGACRCSLLLAVMSACSPGVLTPSLEPGEHLIWAMIDDANRPLATGFVPAGAPPVAVPLDARIVFLVVPKDGLIDADGPLSAPAIAGIRAHLGGGAPDGTGACGRCLAPTKSWPMPLLPGNTCPLPSEVGARAFDGRNGEATEISAEGALTGLRGQLELAIPGACGCERSPPDLDGVSFDLRPYPETPLALRAVSAGSDGALYGSLPEGIFKKPPGEPAMIFPSPFAAPTTPIAMGALANGDFLLASNQTYHGELGAHRLDRLHFDGTRFVAEEVPTPLPFQATGVFRPANDPLGRVFVTGRTLVYDADAGPVLVCDAAASRCDLDAFSSQYDQEPLEALDALPDGRFFGASDSYLYFKQGPDSPWSRRNLLDIRLAPPAETPLYDNWRVLAGPEMIVACIADNLGRGSLVRIPYAPDGTPDATVAATVTGVPPLGGHCTGEMLTPSGFTFWSVTDELIELDERGEVVRTERVEGVFPAPMFSLRVLIDGRITTEDLGGSTYVGPSLDRLEKVHGPPDPFPGNVVALLGGPSRIVAVTSRGAILEITASGTRRIGDPRSLTPPGITTIQGAALDAADPGKVWIAAEPGVAAVQLGSGEITAWDWSPADLAGAMAVVSPKPGELYVADQARNIWAVDTLGLQHRIGEIPMTSHSTGQLRRIFFSTEAGVTWLWTFDGTIMRGVGAVFEALPVIERGKVFDVSIYCPDQLLVSGAVNGAASATTLRTAVGPEGGRYEADEHELPGGSRLRINTSLWERDGQVAWVTTQGILLHGGVERGEELWIEPYGALQTEDLVAIGGYRGQLVVGRRSLPTQGRR